MLVLLRFSNYLIFRCEISGPQGKGASPSRTSARRWRGYGDRMMRLAAIRIATKIFGVVSLLLVVAVGSGATGIVGLGMQYHATDRIALAGTRKIGKANVRNPDNNAQHVCRLLLEKKKHRQTNRR